MTVYGFKAPMLQTAEMLSKRGNPVYFYSLDYKGQFNLWSALFGPLASVIPVESGIGHADGNILKTNS